jgi:CRP/FNR family transcriptional regulator, cyclic AMP receptor protein
VRISVPSPEGREIVLAILQPGEVFGEIALLDGKERTADAMTGCDLAVLERRDVMEFLERQPNAWPRLVEVLCGRLRASDLHMAELAMQPLPVRLAKVLLRMAHSEALGRPADRVQVSQRELGNIVGAARESVNKMPERMAAVGLRAHRGNVRAIPARLPDARAAASAPSA